MRSFRLIGFCWTAIAKYFSTITITITQRKLATVRFDHDHGQCTDNNTSSELYFVSFSWELISFLAFSTNIKRYNTRNGMPSTMYKHESKNKNKKQIKHTGSESYTSKTMPIFDQPICLSRTKFSLFLEPQQTFSVLNWSFIASVFLSFRLFRLYDPVFVPLPVVQLPFPLFHNIIMRLLLLLLFTSGEK